MKKIIENIKGISKVVPQKTLSYRKNLLDLRPNYVVHGDDWQKGVQQPTRQDAIDFITRNDSEDAQEMRDLLYYKGIEIAKKNYMFAIMFDEIFYEEISYYGIGTS